MRIGLDNRAIKFSGIGVYTRNLNERFVETGNYVSLYNDGLVVSRERFFKKYINFLKRILKEQLGMDIWFKKNSLELYHVPKNTGVPFFHNIPVVVTIHDIIPHVFPDKYLSNILERIWYELAIRVSIHRSDKILTISNFSKEELIRYYDVDSSKIEIVYLAYNEAFRTIEETSMLNDVKERYRLNNKYILAIGGSEYRKNIQRLINVYLENFRDNYELIVVGGKWRDIDLSKKYQGNNIRFITGVPEEDLIAIYNMASVFVFPSFYEGFGIPVLEGMACGVPVVTSNVSSMPEVGGDAAIYFNPYDEDDMAEKIKMVLDDKQLREEMISKGLEKVKEYSWEKCAKETLKVYEEVLER